MLSFTATISSLASVVPHGVDEIPGDGRHAEPFGPYTYVWSGPNAIAEGSIDAASAGVPSAVDRNDTMAFHDQVAAEIRRDALNGDVRPSERLPPARDMAAVLGVHTNTVLRALRILRVEGVLEVRRGRGVTVSGEPERGVLWSQAQDLLAQARQLGLQRVERVSTISSLP
jgi:GntR family transcriptional regulator